MLSYAVARRRWWPGPPLPGRRAPVFATALDNLGLLHKIVGNYIDTGHYCYKRWSSAPTRQQSMQPRCACRGAWRCAPRGAVLARANCSGGI